MTDELLGWLIAGGIFLLFIAGIYLWLILYNKWFNSNG